MYLTKIVIFVLIIFLFSSSFIFAQGLIIDHNAVNDFDIIPNNWLDSAKTLTMHYGHASHGMQIISGLKYIEDNVDAEKYNVAFLTYQSDPVLPPDNGEHRICDCGWHPEDYWASEEGRNETRRFANSGLFDYSMFGWCGELSGSEDLTDYINDYLNTLDIFEQEFPNMRFIYQTGHADGYPDYSRLRIHNDQIREYCRENDKILYDFADIENWDPDGNFYPYNTVDCSWCEEWVLNHPMPNLPEECNHGLYTCCPHSHGYNCYIKAKAYWYMMTRLAGWDPESDDTPLPVYLKSFELHVNKKSVILYWETASELNNYGFDIERAIVSNNKSAEYTFKKIAFVEGGKSSSSGYNYSYRDDNILHGYKLLYRLRQINLDGTYSYSNIIETDLSIDEFELYQNYPNPFNSSTKIGFALPDPQIVKISIYNMLGQEIKTIVNKYMPEGYHEVEFQTDNLASGIYIYKIKIHEVEKSREMVIAK